MIPKPTKHFPKYTIIEATSLFQDFKTQKVFSFQIVRPPKKSFWNAHRYNNEERMTTVIPKSTNHFLKYTIIEATSLFQDFKTPKFFLHQYKGNDVFSLYNASIHIGYPRPNTRCDSRLQNSTHK